jgi:putative ABC transport system permease protein
MNLRYALRQLAKSPGFAAVSVITLALGIGANTAIFSFISSWMLRPSPFPQIDRLVLLFENNKKTGAETGVAPGDFADWRAKSGVFEDLGAASFESYNLTGSDEPVKIPGFGVTANFFRTLGVVPALGREFAESEQNGSSHVAILSHELWRDRFSSDRSVLGRTITLDGFPTTIVGVMKEDFQYIPMGAAQIFTPVNLSPEILQSRARVFLRPVGRLKPGVTVAGANAAIAALQASLEAEYPLTNSNRGAAIRTLVDEINRQSGNNAIRIVYATVCFVLLMACANVANLIMSRSSGRRKEMAVRLAIGAGRWQLIRQLLIETMILFIAGAAGGILLARLGVAYLMRVIPARSLPYLPNHGRVDVDAQVLLFTIGVALVTGILFGLAPALEGTRFDLNTILKDAGSRGTTSASSARIRKILVGGEMAMAVMVVVCGALLVNSFIRMRQVDLGYNGDRVLVAELTLPPSYKTPVSINQFANAILERTSPIAGVERASIARYTPASDNGVVQAMLFEGRPDPPPGQAPVVRLNNVSAGYMESLSIGVTKGRTITREDTADSTPVIVINETIAARFFPGEDPIGKRIRIQQIPRQIVGVVKEVKYYSPASPSENQAYLPFAQALTRDLTLVVRTAGDPSSIAQQIRGVVREIDPNQPVARIESIANRIEQRSAPDKILTQMTAFFGILALFLAAIGLYAVMAHSVAQRTQEIGVRMALGARAGDVLKLVIRQGMAVVVTGMILGLGGAFLLTRSLAFFLYGVDPRDPATFSEAFFLLAAVALFACWIPARRAARVDPLIALRYE